MTTPGFGDDNEKKKNLRNKSADISISIDTMNKNHNFRNT